MVIEKKSSEILKQQKESFLNFIKIKEKYSGAIADLFYDDEIAKIEDMDSVKQYLRGKGISKELVDELESDYISYLRDQGFYGSADSYPIGVKESIKKNDGILRKIKKDILKNYKQEEDFLTLDVNKFLDEGFDFFNEKNEPKSIWNDIKKLENENDKLRNEIRELEYRLSETGFFKLSVKTNLKKEIEIKKHQYEDAEQEIKKKELQSQKIKSIKSDIKSFVGGEECWNSMEACEKSMLRIKEQLEEIIDYIQKETINEIKGCIEEHIYMGRKPHKENIIEKINKYLNYFYFGEDKNVRIISMGISFNHDKNGINHYREELCFKGGIPTIYSKNRIDLNIVGIINRLGLSVDGIDEFESGLIDYDFLDDVFIHTTGFDVLDEILMEGGLVSTNEARRRGKNNHDIEKSITQKYAGHKDIYFSRGFRKNGYGGDKSEDDFVFIANTMINFANDGYGVPLSRRMQPNAGLSDVDANHDGNGYSIISKSALEKNSWGDNKYSYSKIDVKHFYIFVSETKRSEIESNPKYKTQNANIIYFPKEYKGKMSYKLYEFIKNEIALRDQGKGKISIIPNKIITDEDGTGIESISTGYRRAFCDSAGDTPEVLFNPLRNGDNKTIINFLKANKSLNFEIDFSKLENFLSEQKSNIDNFELPFDYPKELLLLTVLCTRLGLGCRWDGHKRHDDKMDYFTLIKNKLKEFGYTTRDLGILCKSVEWISSININHSFLLRDVDQKSKYCSSIKQWCKDWLVDFYDMRDFLIKISNISLGGYLSNFLKEMLK